MGAIIALAAIIAVVFGRRRRSGETEHDETSRAGSSPEATQGEVIDRAQGSTAWMRPGGF